MPLSSFNSSLNSNCWLIDDSYSCSHKSLANCFHHVPLFFWAPLTCIANSTTTSARHEHLFVFQITFLAYQVQRMSWTKPCEKEEKNTKYQPFLEHVATLFCCCIATVQKVNIWPLQGRTEKKIFQKFQQLLHSDRQNVLLKSNNKLILHRAIFADQTTTTKQLN